MVVITRSDESELLERILPHLDRGDARDDQWPDAKGEYWAICPFHQDEHVGSFSASVRGYKCHACDAKGSLGALANALGVAVLQVLQRGKTTHTHIGTSYSVAEYAADKQLDEALLRQTWGLSDRPYAGAVSIRIPYMGEDGEEIAVRFRCAKIGENRFRWAKGSHAVPYGQQRLADARRMGRIIIVEGESDCHTLWQYEQPALGIPGASVWKAEWGLLTTGIEAVYLWCEPDQGGETLLSRVGASIPSVRVITPPVEIKDPSALHLAGRMGELEALLAGAVPYSEMQKRTASATAVQALDSAGPLVRCADLLAAFGEAIASMGLVGEDRNAKIIYLALTSRMLSRPVSIVVKGVSSAGKSFTVEVVLRFMPTEAYLDFTSMSERALIYDKRPLDHRFIVLFELAGLSNEDNLATELIRTLLSEGKIKYVSVQKSEDGLEPVVIERTGPTGLLSTTTMTAWHPENETRYFSLLARDDAAQTRSVMASIADRFDGHHGAPVDLGPWVALQTWLQSVGPWQVHIPYARQLAEGAYTKTVRMRRDFTALLTLVSAHALLHRASREVSSEGRIIATVEDYRVVYDLIHDYLAQGVEATVSATTRETVNTVAAMVQDTGKPVTTTQLAGELGIDKSAASRRVGVAVRGGYLVNQEDKRGKPARVVVGDPLPADTQVLPKPDDLYVGVLSTPPTTPATVQQLVVAHERF